MTSGDSSGNSNGSAASSEKKNGIKNGLDDFYESYHQFHIYFAAALSILGLILNPMMVSVLVQRKMRSAVNVFLTVIAIVQTLLMTSYLIYLYHYDLRPDDAECWLTKYNWAWAAFSVAHADSSIVLRAISLWLAAVMAGYRCRLLLRPLTMAANFLKQERLTQCIRVVLATIAFCWATSTPVIMLNGIKTVHGIQNYSKYAQCQISTLYYVDFPDYAHWHNGFLLRLAFWINGLLFKFIPCCILVYYLVRLITYLYRYKAYRQVILNNNNSINISSHKKSRQKLENGHHHSDGDDSPPARPTSPNHRITAASPIELPSFGGSIPACNNNVQTDACGENNDRTNGRPKPFGGKHLQHRRGQRISVTPSTYFLTVILIVTFVAEAPNAIISMYSAVSRSLYGGASFHYDLYKNLGDLFDDFSLIAANATFPLYCLMSEDFRRTFVRTFTTPPPLFATNNNNNSKRTTSQQQRTILESKQQQQPQHEIGQRMICHNEEKGPRSPLNLIEANGSEGKY